MARNIEEEYNKISKKFKLPKFKEINEEFEIGDLEITSFVLRNILRKIAEKLEFYANTINDLLQPDTSSLSSMHEIRFFSDDDKNNLFELFKKLMKTYRKIIILVLEHDEKKQADFLNNFVVDWLEIKKQLIVNMNKIEESWGKETTKEEDLGYFG